MIGIDSFVAVCGAVQGLALGVGVGTARRGEPAAHRALGMVLVGGALAMGTIALSHAAWLRAGDLVGALLELLETTATLAGGPLLLLYVRRATGRGAPTSTSSTRCASWSRAAPSSRPTSSACRPATWPASASWWPRAAPGTGASWCPGSGSRRAPAPTPSCRRATASAPAATATCGGCTRATRRPRRASTASTGWWRGATAVRSWWWRRRRAWWRSTAATSTTVRASPSTTPSTSCARSWRRSAWRAREESRVPAKRAVQEAAAISWSRYCNW